MATTSLAFRLLDTHVVAGRADELAWAGDGALTFAQLLHESASIAGGLRHVGVGEGDAMQVDLAGRDRLVALLAIVRLGALPDADGAVVLAGDPPVVRAGGEEVSWDVLRDIGRTDPVGAAAYDAEGYEATLRTAYPEIIDSLLRGEPLA